MRRSTSAWLVAVALLSSSAAAEESVEKAKTLYNSGLDLRDAGDHKGAKKMFEAALAAVKSPIVALDLAREHVALGELVAALEVASSVAAIPMAPEETEKSALARAEAAKLAVALEKRVATIVVAGPPNALLVIDGTRVETASKRVDPGKHTVFVGSVLTRFDVDLKEGETKKIVVDTPAPVVVPPPAPPPVVERKSHTLTYVGLSTTGVGLVVGTITGVLAISRADSVRDRCSPSGECAPSASSDLSAVRTLGTISTISFAVAGSGLVLAAFGWVRDSESKPQHALVRPWLGVGSAGVVGSF
jgi:hypothetical protein